MNYFTLYKEDEFVNVFKEFTIPDELMKSKSYTLHKVNDFDNLMKLSYEYYQNVEDWWIIYYFNKFRDASFAILSDAILKETIDYYVNLIYTYEEISIAEQLEIAEVVRQYYRQTYSLVESIQKTNVQLSTYENRHDLTFITDFRNVIMDYIISTTDMTDDIKIPDLFLVYKFRAYFNELSITWKS